MRPMNRNFRGPGTVPVVHNNMPSMVAFNTLGTEVPEHLLFGRKTDVEQHADRIETRDTVLYYVKHGAALTAFGPGSKRQHRQLPFSTRLSVWHEKRELPGISDFILNIDTKEIFILTDTPLSIEQRASINFYMPFHNAYMGSIEVEITGTCINSSSCPNGMYAFLINCSTEKINGLVDFFELKGLNINLVV